MSYHRNPIYDHGWKLYQSGMSLAEVANELGVKRQGVWFAFKRRGYQMRSVARLKVIEYDGRKFTRRRDGKYRMTAGKRQIIDHYIWEKYNCPIPAGWCIVHRDRNTNNIDPDNLECVPRSDSGKYARHNNHHTKGEDNRVVNKFCLNCGRKISGCPSYRQGRDFCSHRCTGEYRKGTPKGAKAANMVAYKASKSVYGGNLELEQFIGER
jgi:HNH endonuclease